MAERLIIGVTGASGAVLAEAVLRMLLSEEVETHLVITEAGKLTWNLETGRPVDELYALADVIYDEKDYSAAIASGSFSTAGMIIVPCSMKSLAGIASGYTENLLLRAADVCLKEGRKVVLVPREMPLGRVHLRNLLTASELGCTIIPPVLTFYNDAGTVEKQVEYIAARVLMQFGIKTQSFTGWTGAKQ